MPHVTDFPITARWPATDPTVIQLYSFPTPNGVKISIALEELGLPYEAHRVTLSDFDVRSAAFLSLNPNNKIPALIDPDGPGGADIALAPWLRGLDFYGVKDLVGWHDLPNCIAYLDRFLARPAVQKGLVTPPRDG